MNAEISNLTGYLPVKKSPMARKQQLYFCLSFLSFDVFETNKQKQLQEKPNHFEMTFLHLHFNILFHEIACCTEFKTQQIFGDHFR